MKMFKSELPSYEIIASLIFWSVSVFYALFKFSNSCDNIFKDYDDVYNDFSDGWSIIGRRKDISDEEWETTLVLLKIILPWLIVHLLLTEIIREINIRAIQTFQILFSLLFMVLHVKLLTVIIFILQPVLFRFCSKFKRVFILWICSGFCLFLCTYYKFLNEEEINFIEISVTEHVISIIALFWINIRCLSFYADKINLNCDYNLVNLLAYTFYLPLLFCGPFITYNDYLNFINEKSKLNTRLVKLIFQLLRVGFWVIFTEIALHFVYINAMSYQIEEVKKFDPWTMYGYGYAMGQFFHLKYVILYGFSTAFASFEGVTVPYLPKCIGRIHLYSDMWKHFDEGLYKFLLRYIYIPTLYRKNLINKLFSSLLCFMFVYIWHGTQTYILIWTLLNFTGITAENLFKHFYKKHNFCKKLTNNAKRRLSALLAAPLLAISAMTNFYFFGGTHIGDIFFNKFFSSSIKTNSALLGLLYCCCQISIEIKKIEKNKLTKD